MNIHRILGLVATLAALALSGTAAAADNSELAAFKKAIRAQYDMKEKAFADKDANAIVDGFYTKDVISAGEGEPPMVGREAIRPMYQEIVKGAKVRVESFDTKVSGDMGWDWANFHVMPNDPKEQPFTFVIVFLWEKVGGKWMSAGDMFIKGKYDPAAGAGAHTAAEK